MLQDISMGFRNSFEFDPSMYNDVIADQADSDMTLHFDQLPQVIEKWESPLTADPTDQMASELAKMKDMYMEGLQGVMERGEKLDALCDKTDNLRTTTMNYKKKSKKKKRR